MHFYNSFHYIKKEKKKKQIHSVTGIVGMERFMKGCWFVCVVEFTACAKPLLMAEMITFYKCSPQFDRNHAVRGTRECFTNGTSSLSFTRQSLCVFLYFRWTKVNSFGPQQSSNELSHIPIEMKQTVLGNELLAVSSQKALAYKYSKARVKDR